MGKDKLRRFHEIKSFSNVTEYAFGQGRLDLNLQDIFHNNHSVVLELGCGKGEYTIELSKLYPNKNFIGVDIKGNRLYVGAKKALENDQNNVHFVRTRIDFIEQCFLTNSIDEIWLTFSDPQPKKPRKRLSSPLFVSRYRNFLKEDGIIHLKTDNTLLFDYTMEEIERNRYKLFCASKDVYADMDRFDEELQKKLNIKTHYENLFSSRGERIKYCQFSI